MLRRRRLPPRRADVPRERLVLPVLLHDDRRQAGLPRPAPRSREPARGLRRSKVTVTAGVPTIWMGILQTLDANPGVYDLSSIRFMTVGGAAPPRAMIEAFSERHGLHIVHGWGMTEMSPVGTISGAPGQETGLSPQEAYSRRAHAGPPDPVRRDPRERRGRLRPLGRRDDGRARGARPVDLVGVLRVRRGRRPLDGRRLVQDGRRRDDPPRRRSSRCRTARRIS